MRMLLLTEHGFNIAERGKIARFLLMLTLLTLPALILESFIPYGDTGYSGIFLEQNRANVRALYILSWAAFALLPFAMLLTTRSRRVIRRVALIAMSVCFGLPPALSTSNSRTLTCVIPPTIC